MGGTLSWLEQPGEQPGTYASTIPSGSWRYWSNSCLPECRWYLRRWLRRRGRVRVIGYTTSWRNRGSCKLAGGLFRHSRHISRVLGWYFQHDSSVFKTALCGLAMLREQRSCWRLWAGLTVGFDRRRRPFRRMRYDISAYCKVIIGTFRG